jgi:hypothetical protein
MTAQRKCIYCGRLNFETTNRPIIIEVTLLEESICIAHRFTHHHVLQQYFVIADP